MLLRALITLCATLLAAPSQAVYVSGSFTGVLTSESTYWGDPVPEHVGGAVKGNFYFDTANFVPLGSGSYMFNDADGIDNFLLHVQTPWHSSDETAGTHLIDITHNASGDSLTINAFYPGGYGSLLTLRGTGLFSGGSLDSIQPGWVNVAASSGYSGYIPEGGRNGYYFSLTSANIKVAAVPEPTGLAMMGLGLALMMVVRRQGRG